jgi:hypothetical protein
VGVLAVVPTLGLSRLNFTDSTIMATRLSSAQLSSATLWSTTTSFMVTHPDLVSLAWLPLPLNHVITL